MVLDSTLPALIPFLPNVTPLSPFTAAIRGRVYFCNLLEDRQLDFLGSFGYRISVRLPRSGPRSGDPNGPQIRSWGNGRGDHLHLPRIIPLFLLSHFFRAVRLNMHGECIYDLRRLCRRRWESCLSISLNFLSFSVNIFLQNLF